MKELLNLASSVLNKLKRVNSMTAVSPPEQQAEFNRIATELCVASALIDQLHAVTLNKEVYLVRHEETGAWWDGRSWQMDPCHRRTFTRRKLPCLIGYGDKRLQLSMRQSELVYFRDKLRPQDELGRTVYDVKRGVDSGRWEHDREVVARVILLSAEKDLS